MRILIRQAITQADLLFWEWLVAYKYDDLGYCWDKLGQLPNVMITLSPLSSIPTHSAVK